MADYPHDTWGIERRNKHGFWELVSIPVGATREKVENSVAYLGGTHRAVPITITRRFLNTEETGTEAKEAA